MRRPPQVAGLGHDFATVDEAVHGLLGETVNVLGTVDRPYVVIGGWSPVLLAEGPVRHPGTRDVDVLFNGGDARMELESAFRAFLDNGYIPSAKHPFQVIRVLSVAGSPLAFNVDLLHPDGADLDGPFSSLFVDQLDLGMPLNQFGDESYLMKSIVVPSIRFVFDDRRFVDSRLECTLPDGSVTTITVPVIDELGLIISKSKTVRNPKRERDALDVALSVAQARDPDDLRRAATDLERRGKSTFLLLGHIYDALYETNLTPSFGERVARSLPENPPGVADYLTDSVKRFLSDVGVSS